MKPTLFLLAAGMGSRYGGLKQLDGLGPNGETIMDYSIFDAIRGGFGKLVFVIRKSFEKDFREKIISKYENHIPVEVVFQDLNDLPEGFTCPEGREKPWGTNHAVLMGKKVINEPFAVINADDFYGRDSFAVLGKQLSEMDGKKNDYCMVGYRVGNTLSESGSVARGVCHERGRLSDRRRGTYRYRTYRRRYPVCRRERKEGRIGRKHAGLHEYVGLHSRLFRVFRGILQRVLESEHG